MPRAANPSHKRKVHARKQRKGRYGVSSSVRQFCMECSRFIDRKGQPTGKPLPSGKRALAESHGYCRPCADVVRARLGLKPKSNPSEPAERLSEAFHGQPARKLGRLTVRWPHGKVVYLGPCASLDYVSDKWDRPRRRYRHEFKDCHVFAAANSQPRGRSLLLLVGNFKVKPEGITG